MEYSRNLSLNRFIAKAYLYFLPIRMISPLVGPTTALHGISLYFDLIPHVFGLGLAITSNRGKIYIGDKKTSSLLKMFTQVVIWFSVSSIFMSIIIQLTYGNYAGETAFSGIVGQLSYFIHYVFIVLYNIYVFKIISKDEIDKILGRVCWFLLLLGYYQALGYIVGEPFRTLGSIIDIFHVLFPEAGMTKLSLTASEGAKAGGIFAILVLPYLLAKAITSESSTKYYIQVVLWVPIVIFMQSTSAYLMVIAELLSFIYYALKNSEKQGKKLLRIMLLGLLIGSFAFLFIPETLFGSFFDKNAITYLIFNKINDSSNGSTMLRTAPLIVNWKTFLKFPIFGVGNGLQGYFYTEFFPQEILNLAGVYSLYATATKTIVNGALFFPSILSGYGIVGCVLFCSFIIKLLIILNVKRDGLDVFYVMFCIALIPILFHGFQTEFAGSYFIWFVLSIPFMPETKNTTND